MNNKRKCLPYKGRKKYHDHIVSLKKSVTKNTPRELFHVFLKQSIKPNTKPQKFSIINQKRTSNECLDIHEKLIKEKKHE